MWCLLFVTFVNEFSWDKKEVVCELEDYLRRQSGKILCSVLGEVQALLLLLHNSLGKMGMTQQCGFIGLLVVALCLFAVESYPVEITYLQSAVAKGAVCLDGSPPAYHFSPGFGKGVNNWLVHFEGGAWCSTTEECRARQKQRLGSSKFMVKTLQFSGFFSNKAKSNPDFFDWNKIKVRYCDGSSFTGDVEAVDPATNLHYRGERIFDAVIEDLKQKGMSRAQNALISGCSAGGLASILHCDKFRSLLPASTNVKCFSDAGYFINAKDITGVDHTKSVFSNVVKLHGSLKNLPSSCTSRLSDPTMCFFPQYVTSQIRTPLFLLNAAYDSYQIKNTLAPGVADRKGAWKSCKSSITKCSSSQLTTMHDFRAQFLSALKEGSGPSTRGYFINSCYAHCESGVQATWLASGSPSLENTSIAKAVGDWFYNRKSFQAIDCPYPCNKSCQNRVFED